MSRYQGFIGFKGEPVEGPPGIFTEPIVRVKYQGDIQLRPVRWSSGERDQQTVTANHILAIVAPESSMANFANALYIEWQDRKWSITSIEYIRPKIRLAMGGLYNGAG